MNAREFGALVPLIVTIERVNALAIPLRSVLVQVEAIRETSIDLGPELAAIEARVEEAVEHVLAAQRVLSARIELMKDAA